MRDNAYLQRLLFTIVTILYWTAMYIYVPILSPYLSAQHYSLQFIGIVIGSYGFIQMLIRFPLGMMSDGLGKRKPFILFGMLTAAVSSLLFLIPGLWVWPLAGRVVAGLCASTWVAFTVMYAAYFSDGQTGKAMGHISVMTVVGQMLGMLLSGWLTEWLTVKAPFVAGAVIGSLGLLLAMMLKEPQRGVFINRKPADADRRTPGETNIAANSEYEIEQTAAPTSGTANTASASQGMTLSKLSKVIRSRSLLQASLLSILAHCVLFITMFGFTPLKAEQLGAGGTGLMLVVLAFMLPHAVASFMTAAWFVPRIGYSATLGIGFLLSAVCTGAMVYAPSLELLIATQAVNGFAQGLHLPLLLGLAIRDAEPSSRATAMGLYQALYAIGMFSGPFLAGWLSEQWGLDSGFLFGAILGAAAALLVWAWAKQEKRSMTRKQQYQKESSL